MQHVHPFGLILKNLPQLCLGGFLGQEEVQRLAGYLCASDA
jgi:hypothetical protein